MAEHGDEIMDVLTDEQIERLKDGEELEFLAQIREPLLEDSEPTSINTVKLQFTTCGAYGGKPLEEAFEDVIGL